MLKCLCVCVCVCVSELTSPNDITVTTTVRFPHTSGRSINYSASLYKWVIFYFFFEKHYYFISWILLCSIFTVETRSLCNFTGCVRVRRRILARSIVCCCLAWNNTIIERSSPSTANGDSFTYNIIIQVDQYNMGNNICVMLVPATI